MVYKNIIKKIGIISLIGLALWLLYRFTPVHTYLTLDYIQQQSIYFKQFAHQHYWLAAVVYIALFACAIALSIPVSIVLTLLGGYLFGLWYGTLFATISVTTGVMAAYIVLKFFYQYGSAQDAHSDSYNIAQSIRANGTSYLLLLHFSAILPYFIINMCAILAGIPARTVAWTTIVGFLPQGFVYALAGKELGSIKQVSDIFSREIIIAFILLMVIAYLPIVIKRYKVRIRGAKKERSF